jgi:hypothetical protein
MVRPGLLLREQALRLSAAVFSCALLLVPADGAPQLSAALECARSGPVYNVSVSGVPLFDNSLPLAVFSGGQWERSWQLVDSREVSGSDALGAFSGTQCFYSLSSDPAAPFISTVALTYVTTSLIPGLVRFQYTFPQGATNTNHSNPAGTVSSTISTFPGFASKSCVLRAGFWLAACYCAFPARAAFLSAGCPCRTC